MWSEEGDLYFSPVKSKIAENLAGGEFVIFAAMMDSTIEKRKMRW